MLYFGPEMSNTSYVNPLPAQIYPTQGVVSRGHIADTKGISISARGSAS